MKKGKLVIITFIIVALCLLITKANYKQYKNITVNIKNNNFNFISMMLEDDKGNYIENKNSSFSFDEYMFNAEARGCENGGILSWNKENQKVEVSLLTSDKCYAYFDKYDFTKSCMLGYEDNLACDIFKKKDETLIYHNGTIKSGDIIIDAHDYSYRFSGAGDIVVYNYVCLGTNNNATGECDANDLYRIIGLFKNDNGHYEIKLIKNTPYEGPDSEPASNTDSGKGYRWSGSSDNQKNTWKDSTLNTIVLNQNYLNSLPQYVQAKITIHNYITGGNTQENISQKYVYEAFQNEIISPSVGEYATEEDKTYDKGKVGLMYASDYCYAAYQNAWTAKTLGNYNDTNIKNNNWLYMGSTEWLVLRRSDYSDRVFAVSYEGYVNAGIGSSIYNHSYAVRPVFFLDYNATSKSGEGTLLNPYRLS